MFIDYNKFLFNKVNVLNLLISAIPLSLIIGNLATNINIIFIFFLGFYVYGKKIFYIKQKKYEFLVYCFFIYIIAITLINNWQFFLSNDIYLDHFIKSLLFVRFLFLFLIINKLIEDNNFNTKIFFISGAFFSIIISIDITIQFFLNKNIIGIQTSKIKPSSFFGDENIAGGFMQKFIFFAIFYFLSQIKNKKKIHGFFLIFSLIGLIPIILSGNRMPVIIFISSILVYFFLEKKIKQLAIAVLISTFIIFGFVKYIKHNRLDIEIRNFYYESVNIVTKAPNLFINNPKDFEYSWKTGYLIHFNTGIQIWKENKFFGHGIKSFRLNCTYDNNQTCNTHPHNYFIEIMVDAGLVGIIIIYLILIFGILDFFKYYSKERKINSKLTALIFFILIFFEFFPLRSTGSFFTTNNSIFIFLILPIFLNIKKITKL